MCVLILVCDIPLYLITLNQESGKIFLARTQSDQFQFYQTTNDNLKKGTEPVPETQENCHTLTRLSAREHLIAFCRRESFKI